MSQRKTKIKVIAEAGISLPAQTISKALTLDASGNLVSSATSDAELAFLSGTTSSVQTQINSAKTDATNALTNAATAQSTIDNHVVDTASAHSASAIANTPLGNLAATDMQGAVNELQGEADTITANLAQEVTNRTNADQNLQNQIDALPDGVVYKGTWDASTNTPTLSNLDTGKTGFLYRVNVAGTVNFGAGAISFAAGDRVVNNGTIWDKWDMTDAVNTVFGRAGDVVATSGDYTASQITNVPAGTLVGTNVQAVVNELDTDVQAVQADATNALANAATAQTTANNAQTTINDHIADTIDVHDASAISYDNTGSSSITTNLQDAVDELSSLGDIFETSFSLANNQVSATNVTGFVFAPATVRSFLALVSVEIDATVDLYEQFTLNGINKNGSFNMTVERLGDNSSVVFSITSTGQIQYTSGNYSGFVSGLIKFRAITTTI